MKIWPAGYTDTPTLPDSQWHVHDPQRPQPPVVTPPVPSSAGRVGTPPSDAVVLFDGTDIAGWTHLDGADPQWQVDNGELLVVPSSGDIRTTREFGSCQLHLEWQAPREITATSQGRGNSGVFLLGLYEIQVLDGYENPTYADGQTGAIYGQHPALVNACVPPGEWHSYDIVFEAPVFVDNRLQTPAYMTLFHNGVLAHLRQRLDGPTQHRELASYEPVHPERGPLVLQDHRDPVRFRNIWLRELGDLQAR